MLSQMKSDIKQLQGQSVKIVNNLLQDQNLWCILLRLNYQTFIRGVSLLSLSIKRFVLLAGELSSILEKYQYLSSPDGEPEIWREFDSSGVHFAPNARRMYPYQIDWTEKMKMFIKQYEDIRNKAYPVIESIKNLELEKSRKEAFDLWNIALMNNLTRVFEAR